MASLGSWNVWLLQSAPTGRQIQVQINTATYAAMFDGHGMTECLESSWPWLVSMSVSRRMAPRRPVLCLVPVCDPTDPISKFCSVLVMKEVGDQTWPLLRVVRSGKQWELK